MQVWLTGVAAGANKRAGSNKPGGKSPHFSCRHGSELSSSSKTRVFVSGFGSSKKFEVRTKVHEPSFKEKISVLLTYFFVFRIYPFKKNLGKKSY